MGAPPAAANTTTTAGKEEEGRGGGGGARTNCVGAPSGTVERMGAGLAPRKLLTLVVGFFGHAELHH
jgi:hypothetical protein